MALRENIEYWRISLANPEPLADEFYVFDEIIADDPNLTAKIERLRELIIAYCVMTEKNATEANGVLDEIYSIIVEIERIQYTEFVAFWKVLDMSYSVFKTLTNKKKKEVLARLLRRYCERRRRLYDKLGYSNVTVQALYDSGASRKKGTAGPDKIIALINEILGDIPRVEDLGRLEANQTGYFLPDKGGRTLFGEFCGHHSITYNFARGLVY